MQFSHLCYQVSFEGYTPIPRLNRFSLFARRYSQSESMNLTDGQVNDLARPLVGIITKFYADPKNEEDYQKWLRNVEERKQRESTDISSL